MTVDWKPELAKSYQYQPRCSRLRALGGSWAAIEVVMASPGFVGGPRERRKGRMEGSGVAVRASGPGIGIASSLSCPRSRDRGQGTKLAWRFRIAGPSR